VSLRLFDKPECPFCWRVRLAAAWQGRAVERLERSDPTVQTEWARLSPSRSVPLLVDGELVLTDSTAILEYLSETGPTLLPADPAQRARARNLVAYADSPLGVAVRRVVFEKRDKPESDWDPALIRAAAADFDQTLPALEALLKSHRHLISDAFGLADCALLPRFALAARYGMAIPPDYPLLRDWYRRLTTTPAFAASAPEGWISEHPA
jgi:glutathione S-transferase